MKLRNKPRIDWSASDKTQWMKYLTPLLQVGTRVYFVFTKEYDIPPIEPNDSGIVMTMYPDDGKMVRVKFDRTTYHEQNGIEYRMFIHEIDIWERPTRNPLEQKLREFTTE